MKNNKKITLLGLLIIGCLCLVLIGRPVFFKEVSDFKTKKARSVAPEPYLDEDGVITIDLKGLKADQVPVVNMHTIEDLYVFNPALGSQIDFGALEELALLKPQYNGEDILIGKSNDQQTVKTLFKVLTKKNKPNKIVAFIDYKSIYMLPKPINIESLTEVQFSDLRTVVSDTIVLTKKQSCYGLLGKGDLLFEKCKEYQIDPPYHVEYLPKKKKLKVIPSNNPTWEELRVYNNPLVFSYGKVRSQTYNEKGKISKRQKMKLSRKTARLLGQFVLENPSEMNIRATSKLDIPPEDLKNEEWVAKCPSCNERTFDIFKADNPVDVFNAQRPEREESWERENPFESECANVPPLSEDIRKYCGGNTREGMNPLPILRPETTQALCEVFEQEMSAENNAPTGGKPIPPDLSWDEWYGFVTRCTEVISKNTKEKICPELSGCPIGCTKPSCVADPIFLRQLFIGQDFLRLSGLLSFERGPDNTLHVQCHLPGKQHLVFICGPCNYLPTPSTTVPSTTVPDTTAPVTTVIPPTTKVPPTTAAPSTTAPVTTVPSTTTHAMTELLTTQEKVAAYKNYLLEVAAALDSYAAGDCSLPEPPFTRKYNGKVKPLNQLISGSLSSYIDYQDGDRDIVVGYTDGNLIGANYRYYSEGDDITVACGKMPSGQAPEGGYYLLYFAGAQTGYDLKKVHNPYGAMTTTYCIDGYLDTNSCSSTPTPTPTATEEPSPSASEEPSPEASPECPNMKLTDLGPILFESDFFPISQYEDAKTQGFQRLQEGAGPALSNAGGTYLDNNPDKCPEQCVVQIRNAQSHAVIPPVIIDDQSCRSMNPDGTNPADLEGGEIEMSVIYPECRAALNKKAAEMIDDLKQQAEEVNCRANEEKITHGDCKYNDCESIEPSNCIDLPESDNYPDSCFAGSVGTCHIDIYCCPKESDVKAGYKATGELWCVDEENSW